MLFLKRVGKQVDSDNKSALRLYESAGYVSLSLSLSLSLFLSLSRSLSLSACLSHGIPEVGLSVSRGACGVGLAFG